MTVANVGHRYQWKNVMKIPRILTMKLPSNAASKAKSAFTMYADFLCQKSDCNTAAIVDFILPF